jgi:PadR family transcriptional regulator PadR
MDEGKKRNLEKVLRIWSREYKKGFLTYFILLMLKEKHMYGLEISEKLKEYSDNNVTLDGSNIYQILKKLRKLRMVTIKKVSSSKGPTRKYYYIEKNGLKALRIFTEEYVYPLHLRLNLELEKHYPHLFKRSQS